MNKILVTGGAGFIGSELCSRLADDKNNFIVAVDNLSTGNVLKLPKKENILFIKADVNNYSEISEIMLSWHFDYVFHYAATVGVQRTLKNPLLVLRDIEGIKNILQLSKNTGVKRVFYSSSSEIYGEPVEYPQHEITTPLNSRLPYAVVKNVGEAFLRTYYKEFGLKFTIFRFFNTYGEKQSTNFVIPRFISKALRNEDITIYGDGRQTRTFCYIDDNIEATVNAFYNACYINDVVNIGSDIEITILELAKLIIKLTNSKSKIVFLPPLKEGDMKGRRPDITRMKTLISKPLITLEDGIKKILEKGLFDINNENSNGR
ncbi:MAG: NAD-dependent epimerase/dehydratase family protein [Bacteroidales bacterium]|nr:NAD-dependent epimerase/dehydratase family protein [Bacteroidales bacterium]